MGLASNPEEPGGATNDGRDGFSKLKSDKIAFEEAAFIGIYKRFGETLNGQKAISAAFKGIGKKLMKGETEVNYSVAIAHNFEFDVTTGTKSVTVIASAGPNMNSDKNKSIYSHFDKDAFDSVKRLLNEGKGLDRDALLKSDAGKKMIASYNAFLNEAVTSAGTDKPDLVIPILCSKVYAAQDGINDQALKDISKRMSCWALEKALADNVHKLNSKFGIIYTTKTTIKG